VKYRTLQLTEKQNRDGKKKGHPDRPDALGVIYLLTINGYKTAVSNETD
jgi:hypothetical protein